MKRGLVLEGGGLRGLFTAGVLDVFMEHGVKFDGIIGVSAGACFGCNYKLQQALRAQSPLLLVVIALQDGRSLQRRLLLPRASNGA